MPALRQASFAICITRHIQRALGTSQTLLPRREELLYWLRNTNIISINHVCIQNLLEKINPRRIIPLFLWSSPSFIKGKSMTKLLWRSSLQLVQLLPHCLLVVFASETPSSQSYGHISKWKSYLTVPRDSQFSLKASYKFNSLSWGRLESSFSSFANSVLQMETSNQAVLPCLT